MYQVYYYHTVLSKKLHRPRCHYIITNYQSYLCEHSCHYSSSYLPENLSLGENICTFGFLQCRLLYLYPGKIFSNLLITQYCSEENVEKEWRKQKHLPMTGTSERDSLKIEIACPIHCGKTGNFRRHSR